MRTLVTGAAGFIGGHVAAALASGGARVRAFDRNPPLAGVVPDTVEFMRGDYDASVADIERTLKLEPRHFGALSGLGQIYLALNDKPAALKAFEAAVKVNPHLTGAVDMVEKLKKELAGKPT